MTALQLRRIDTGRTMQRFYLFGMQTNLFDRVLLFKNYGHIGERGRLIDDSYDNEASAIDAMRRQTEKNKSADMFD
jgi:predicted DNA-binding WGR domain protein